MFTVWIIKDLAVSPRSLPLRTFCEKSLVASGEERGEWRVVSGEGFRWLSKIKGANCHEI